MVCLSPPPTLTEFVMKLSSVMQELHFLHSILLFISFSENQCSGNHFYHRAENSIRDKGISLVKISHGLLQAPGVRFSFFFKIVSWVSLKGAALNRGAGMRPVNSKSLSYWNFQSSPVDSNIKSRLRTFTSDQWPFREGFSNPGSADIWDQISLSFGTMCQPLWLPPSEMPIARS